MRGETEGYAWVWKYQLRAREAIPELADFFSSSDLPSSENAGIVQDMLINVGLVFLAKAALAIGFGVLILALL